MNLTSRHKGSPNDNIGCQRHCLNKLKSISQEIGSTIEHDHKQRVQYKEFSHQAPYQSSSYLHRALAHDQKDHFGNICFKMSKVTIPSAKYNNKTMQEQQHELWIRAFRSWDIWL
ncbi:Pentatricopeptide repeat-containing protein [Senna tora]|uniref:Pentatricopeptide repeat-containing protein n=1 Tax=Senna tora TaxID=362788 RepID=A0A834X3I1_9FABA|nr:Pentatricopeptide repeat-containing protein [Senna tora]